MNRVAREIFRAIHEGKWLYIEYHNRQKETTRYWIAVRDLHLGQRVRLDVDALHVTRLSIIHPTIYLDQILCASVLEGTWCPVNGDLLREVREHPERFEPLFGDVANLKILSYYADCHRLDATPYHSQYKLLDRLDGARFDDGAYTLDEGQFGAVVREFQQKARRAGGTLKLQELCLNVLSVETPRGLYVLAHRRVYLNVARRALMAAREITVCREFTIDGERVSARRFLDADDYALLDNLEANLELVKDRITAAGRKNGRVNDLPYLIALGADVPLNLGAEYAAILRRAKQGNLTLPMKAFFGGLVAKPDRRGSYPLALADRRVNLDQLLAISNAMKYPLTYVQGPPGTGKTSTIVNTLATAFLGGRTVLFASYNNHPIDGVCEKLRRIPYGGGTLPLPLLRLGNNECVLEALETMRTLYEAVQDISVSGAPERDREAERAAARRLGALLRQYDEALELRERREAMERMLDSPLHLNLRFDLTDRQLRRVDEQLEKLGTVREEDALALLGDGEEASRLLDELFRSAVRHIQQLGKPRNRELYDIVYSEWGDSDRVSALNAYLSKGENLRRFLRIFPLIATTCISAHKLGEPDVYFDMVVMDEASQCNAAVSLVPILRGESLMLVGDPQQLSPVILLDKGDNRLLREKYGVGDKYDYLDQSIYKTFLACDPVSDEVLLRCHYRCHEKIIGFSNQKYYGGRLCVRSRVRSETPLVFLDTPDDTAVIKNTAPREAEAVVDYIRSHREQKIGVITPFTGQRNMICALLREEGMEDVTCGTVHAFQGDEKDVILFSLALTDKTQPSTYAWLKNNRELLNVATSRAREQLVLVASRRELERLRSPEGDDLSELADYVCSNGVSHVTGRKALSRALGVKPYSSQTEEAFLETLSHALGVIWSGGARCTVRELPGYDFVVCEREEDGERPVLAFALGGKPETRADGFEVIRVDRSYARRYHFVKDILVRYFSHLRRER